jgi:hypothetical protein
MNPAIGSQLALLAVGKTMLAVQTETDAAQEPFRP